MKLINDDPNKSQIIKPLRIYRCVPCNRICPRKDVTKRKSDGVHICVHCGNPVEDITNRETGKSFIQVVGL